MKCLDYLIEFLIFGRRTPVIQSETKKTRDSREKSDEFLEKQSNMVSEILGGSELEGTLPGGNHGAGCTCWSCESQLVDRNNSLYGYGSETWPINPGR